MVRQVEGTRLISRGDNEPHSYGTIKYESFGSRVTRCVCTKRDSILVAVVLVGAFIIIAVSLALGLPKIEEKRQHYLDTSFAISSSPLLTFEKAVVVSVGEKCATIGKEILQTGGNAVDAAIATLFCTGVVSPESMGLGGGFLMTIYNRVNRTSTVIDARETAPRNASEHMFDGNSNLAQEGGLSIAIPGELSGYQRAHDMFGKSPWRTLISPSIQLCNDGFKVSSHLANKLQSLRDKILADPSMKDEFFNNATNDLYKAGETMKRPVLGATLLEIADNGAKALYTGSLQTEFLKDISNCGGVIDSKDLADYVPLIKSSVKTDVNGLTLHSVPLPGSGLIVSLILNVLSHYNVTDAHFRDTDEAVLMYHRIVEAFKFSFAQRTRLGDDSFVNLTQTVKDLQSKEFAKSIWEQISDDTTFPTSHYNPVLEPNYDHGTAHVSVLAENGDAVSVTSSINTYFGSRCRSPSTGIILNNAMDDFSSPEITNYFGVPPSPANFIAPGKRPLSSMSPSIVVDSNADVQMVIGAAGGTRIITSSAMGLVRLLWLSEDVKQATDAPRIHHQLFPNHIQHEAAFPKIYLDKLKSYGHSSQLETQASVFLGIVRKDGHLQTNLDFRRGGSADGL